MYTRVVFYLVTSRRILRNSDTVGTAMRSCDDEDARGNHHFPRVYSKCVIGTSSSASAGSTSAALARDIFRRISARSSSVNLLGVRDSLSFRLRRGYGLKRIGFAHSGSSALCGVSRAARG